MRSDVQKEIYDLTIIGGGVAGAAVARDGAMRGLKVVLFEKNTFGSGTSSKSSKLIHGGLRYLELAWNAACRLRFLESLRHFRFVLASIRECQILESLAPDLIRPIPIIVPIYRHNGSPLLIYFGTFLYGIIGFLVGKRKFPKALLSQKQVTQRLEGLRQDNLTGGVIIWDHWTYDRKLVERLIKSAETFSAVCHEHAKVITYGFDPAQNLYKIHILKSGEEKIYLSRQIVNASGPWIDWVRKDAGEWREDYVLPVAGIHLELQPFTSDSCILRAADGRIFFIINYDGRARVGTTERIHRYPDIVAPSEEETEYLLGALEYYFPNKKFTAAADVLLSDAGIRPLALNHQSSDPHGASREHVIRQGESGVLHLIGVKLTDHRRAARDVVSKVIKALPRDRTFNPCLTRKTPF